jgi:hypothetical protein
MTEESYDGSVSLTRRLAEEEIKDLRIQLLPLFHASGGLGVEDITDFLDYTFAMISNNKTVDYVITELIGMEMDFCTPVVARKVGKELASFINQINNNGGESQQEQEPQEGNEEGEEDGDESGNKASRVVSLKVCNAMQMRDIKSSSFFFVSVSHLHNFCFYFCLFFSPQRTKEMPSPCLAPLELPDRVKKPMRKMTIPTKETRKITTTRAASATTTTTTMMARVAATTRIAARSHVTGAVTIAEAAVVTIDEEEEMAIVEVVEATGEAVEETTTDEAAEEATIVEETAEAAALSIPLRLIV